MGEKIGKLIDLSGNDDIKDYRSLRITQRKEADKLKYCDVLKAWEIQHSTIKIGVILVNIK